MSNLSYGTEKQEGIPVHSMLDKIINRPDLDKYLTTFETGQIIFLEGDDTQDLYILVEGELDVLKGNKRINEITGKGALFGEMSFLLGANRTATVKARGDVKTIRIPREEITTFLRDFPDAAEGITKLMAKRLDETSQILFGLKEFCDQLPDAVILADKDGRILTWNSAAEKLYGREWSQMGHNYAEEIYEEPEVYKHFLDEVQSRYSVREKVLRVKHPEKGARFISTSTTVLYDGQHNFQGVLSLGRDVTDVKKLELRYQRAKFWGIPFFFLLVLLSVSLFFGYSYFTQDKLTEDVKKDRLRNQLANDYLLLKSLLMDSLEAGDTSKTSEIMKEFFNIQEKTEIPYTGLVLLDKDKKVFNAYSMEMGADAVIAAGRSYTGIEFQGSEDSLHSILTLYRVDESHPMGHKGIEIAFEISENDRFLGWLVFQMDVDLLGKEYNVDENGLKKFQFEKP